MAKTALIAQVDTLRNILIQKKCKMEIRRA